MQDDKLRHFYALGGALITFVSFDGRLEDDHVVVRHELGHALISYKFGMCVGRIAFQRQHNLTLGAGSRWRQRDTEISTADFLRIKVVRLLAGEVAARRFLGMPLDELCCDYPLSSSYRPEFVQHRVYGLNDDLSKALNIACSVHRGAWYSFLTDCHDLACQIVVADWEGVTGGSQTVEKMGLPQEPMQQLLIPGFALIRAFEQCDVVAERTPPMEVLHKDLPGSLSTRVFRFFRSRVTKTLLIGLDGEADSGLVLPAQ